MENIYLRVDKDNKQIEFHEDWLDARSKKGKIKKYRKNDRNSILEDLRFFWYDVTEAEFNRWKIPEWLRDWISKRMKKGIYITENEGYVYYKFKGDLFITCIKKLKSFKELYDIDIYMYQLLRDMTVFHGFDLLDVYTDVVDLLRINRIFYDGSNESNIIIHIMSYEELRIRMESDY